MRADSICVHEDNPAARQILKTVRRALDGADVRISPLREVLSL
ncbi:LamB/YcsF family protein [Candidatus Cryosericum odellii]